MTQVPCRGEDGNQQPFATMKPDALSRRHYSGIDGDFRRNLTPGADITVVRGQANDGGSNRVRSVAAREVGGRISASRA
jgi:hypothetical protein